MRWLRMKENRREERQQIERHTRRILDLLKPTAGSEAVKTAEGSSTPASSIQADKTAQPGSKSRDNLVSARAPSDTLDRDRAEGSANDVFKADSRHVAAAANASSTRRVPEEVEIEELVLGAA